MELTLVFRNLVLIWPNLLAFALVFSLLAEPTMAVPIWNTWKSNGKNINAGAGVSLVSSSASALAASRATTTATGSWHLAVHTAAINIPSQSSSSSSGTKSDSNGVNAGVNGPALVSSPLGHVEVVNNCPFNVESNIVHAPRVAGIVPEELRGSLKASRIHHGHGENAKGYWNGNGTTTRLEINGSGTGMGNGSTMSHPFLHDPGLGVSWKLSRGDGSGPVQFEWTWVPNQKKVYWDLSMIDAHTATKRSLLTRSNANTNININSKLNGDNLNNSTTPTPPTTGSHHSFTPHGISIIPLPFLTNGQNLTQNPAGNQGNCVPVTCPRNQGVCADAYNAWNDWTAQRDCEEGVSLRVVLCS